MKNVVISMVEVEKHKEVKIRYDSKIIRGCIDNRHNDFIIMGDNDCVTLINDCVIDIVEKLTRRTIVCIGLYIDRLI